MKFQEIQDLIKLISETGIAEFEYEAKELKIRIINTREVETTPPAPAAVPQIIQMPPMYAQQAFAPPASSPAVPVAAPAATPVAAPAAEKPAAEKGNYLEVKSPIVGTFYRSSSPENPPYKKVGDKVSKGDVVCIVEAMKLFNEIESEVTGTIVKVMLDDASPVEYDQVLFLVEPN